MSYCRMSSTSDVYAYYGCKFELCFAASKLKDGMQAKHSALYKKLGTDPVKNVEIWEQMGKLWEPIPLKLESQFYSFETPKELYDKMLEGKAAGYKVTKVSLKRVLDTVKAWENKIYEN